MTRAKTEKRSIWKRLLPALAVGALLGGLTGRWLSHPGEPPTAETDSNALTASRNLAAAQAPAPTQPLPVERAAVRPATPAEMPKDVIAWARTVPPALIGEAMEAALRMPQFNQRQRTVHELIRRWATYDPAAATRYADELRGLGDTSQLVLELVAIWAVQDVQGAAAWVKAKPRDLYPVECAKRIAAAAADTEPEAALALLLDLNVPVHRSYEPYLKIFSRLGAINPQRGAELALALPPVRERVKMLEAVFSKWAQSDPEAAQTWSAQRANRTERQEALQALIPALTKLSPEKTSRAVMQLPVGRRRRDAIAKIAGAWAQQDIAAAVTWIKTLQSDAEASAAVNALMPAWLAWDPDAVQAWIEDRPELDNRTRNRWGGSLRNQWLNHLAESNPQAALDYVLNQNGTTDAFALPQAAINALPLSTLIDAAEALPEVPAKGQLLRGIAMRWAAEDFDAATEWVRTLPAKTRGGMLQILASIGLSQGLVTHETLLDMATRETDEVLRDRITGQLLRQLFEERPDEAIATFRQLPPNTLKDHTLRALFDRWLQHDADSALAEIRGRFRDRTLDETNAQLAYYVATQSPAFAEAELKKLPVDNVLRTALINGLVNKQLQENRSTGEIIAWLDEIDTGKIPPQVLFGLLPRWVQNDAVAAFRYIETIPDAGVQHFARQRVMASWAMADPENALDAAIALPNNPFKAEYTAAAFAGWLRKDANAAEAWLRDLAGVPWRDGPVCAMVRQLYGVANSELAQVWAESIADGELRESWLIAIDDAREERQRAIEAAEALQQR